MRASVHTADLTTAATKDRVKTNPETRRMLKIVANVSERLTSFAATIDACQTLTAETRADVKAIVEACRDLRPLADDITYFRTQVGRYRMVEERVQRLERVLLRQQPSPADPSPAVPPASA